MSDYEKLKQELEALRNKCKELEDKIEQAEQDDEPKFERVPDGKPYYTLTTINGAFAINPNHTAESHWIIDKDRFDNNNYFKIRERAQEVADKINFLLKLERLHDTFCPDYVPNFDDFSNYKGTIYYDHDEKIYRTISCYLTEHRTLVYFPTEEIAQKVCDILNNENKQSACDD